MAVKLWPSLLAAVLCAGCGGKNGDGGNLFDDLGIKYTPSNSANAGTLGGSGSGFYSGSVASAASPFSGHFVGTWSSSDGTGSADLIVTVMGALSGTIQEIGVSSNIAVGGAINSDGGLSASGPDGASRATFSGMVTLSSTGKLTGTVTEVSPNGTSILSLTLAKQ